MEIGKLPGPSLLNMAEAMLLDDFKLSHTSLRSYLDENDEMQESSANRRKNIGSSQKAPQSRSNEGPGQEESNGDEKVGARSVVIQVPSKRRKISSPFTPRQVVDALNNSISMEERLDAVYKAISAFDHDDASLHDLEIEEGSDIALVKMLVFLEFKTGFRRPPIKANLEAITKEISLTCQALEMVYRASSEAVQTSFNRVGNDLMQILVILIDEEVKIRMQAFSPDASPESAASTIEPTTKSEGDGNEIPGSRPVTPPPPGSNAWGVGNWDRDLLLRKAAKILGHFARVGQATRSIAHFPGLLGSTLNLINMRPYDAVPWEARLSCLWTVANLACNTDNMMMMICTPGLINSLVNVGFRQMETSEPLERTMEVLRARSITSRALLNLSWPPENKILMAENLAMVQALCQLAVQRQAPYSKSRTIQDILLQTRRHSVGALRNLAAAPRRSKISLCEHNNGKLLDILTDVTLNDSDDKTVDLAFAAIHNLAIHETAEIMVAKPYLVLALKNSVLDDETGIDPYVPRGHASSTMLVLERLRTPEMSSYENLRELPHPSTKITNKREEDNQDINKVAEV